MAVFEVFIPARDAGSPNVTLTIEGKNWIEALRSGLKSIGEGGEAIANVMCDVKEDGSIHVTDVATRRVFRLCEQKPGAATGASAATEAKAAEAPKTLPPEVPRAVSTPPAPGVPSAADLMGPSPKTMMQFPAFKAPKEEAAPAASPEVEETLRMPVPPPAAPAPASPSPPVVAAKVADLDASVPWTTMPGPGELAAQKLKAADTAPMPPAPPEPADAEPRTPVATEAPPELMAPRPAEAKPAEAKPAEAAPPRVATPGPFARATPAAGLIAPKPATGSQKVVSQQVLDNDTAKVPVFRHTTDETERVSRSPRSVAPPTPRGVPAPAPRRASGQFAQAPVAQLREESKPMPTDPKIGRPVTRTLDVTDAIAAVFDATQDLYMEARVAPEKVAATLLDIALQHVPAESGTFYLADVNGHELSFAAVRGPKADALKRSGMTVPLGQGIIGFCAQEGICLSVSDIQKDPRWLSSIGKKLDYLPKDTLCASAEKDGRLFGAVQLINSKKGFDATHMEVLRFIGLTAAALLERIEAST
ncbi:MAG: GAF domain-containing protein [Deltaproteobacteria bacterium]|nr:GAF domain-containing protein [Deltaproteobacteria bacterium]